MKNYGTIGSFEKEKNDKNKRVNIIALLLIGFFIAAVCFFSFQERNTWISKRINDVMFKGNLDRYLLIYAYLLCFKDAGARQIKEEGSHLIGNLDLHPQLFILII